MLELALVGLNNSHPYVFGGLVNGARRSEFEKNSPAWTHVLFPEHDWEGDFADRARFTVAWARDPQFARTVAGTVGIDRVAGSLEEAAENCDGAFVCDMWGDYHLEQALPFLRRGKPVYVDKPMSEKAADAAEMIEQARRHGTVVTSFSSLRLAPGLLEMKKKMSEGGLGRALTTTVCSPCYQDLARYAVHGIEILFALAEPGRVRRVRNAGTGTRRHLLLLEFEDGRDGVVHSWEGHAYSMTVNAEHGQQVGVVGVNETFTPMVDAVLHCFVSGEPVVPDEEALEVIRVIEAGNLSMTSGGGAVRISHH